MRIVAGLAVAALVLSSSSAPARGSSFEAWLLYEDSIGYTEWLAIPITETINQDGIVIGTVQNWSWTCGEQCGDDGFQILDFNLTLDPDPSITFSQSVVDIGAPSTFGFVFQQTIVPTAAPGTATASLSGSTTHGGGVAGTVTVTPTAPPAGIPQDGDGVEPNEIMVFTLSTSGLPGPWMNVGIDIGPAFSSNPSLISDTYPAINAGPVAGPAGSGSYDAMRVDINFSLSGGGDRFTLNGGATIVPEPTTASLLALGLLGLARAGRRKRI